MGRQTAQRLGIAGVGVILVVIGVLTEWWAGEKLMLRADVTLRDMRVCVIGAGCESKSLSDMMGQRHAMFQMAAFMTQLLAVLVVAGAVAGGALRVLRDVRLPLRLAGLGALGLAFCSVMTAMSFPAPVDAGLELQPSFWMTLIGAVLCAVGALWAAGDESSWEGTEYRPITVTAPVLTDAERQQKEVAKAATSAVPREVVAITPKVPRLRNLPSTVRPVGADTAAAAIRFAVKELTIGDGGLDTIGMDGTMRSLAWAQIGAIVVAQLPIDPPFDKTIFFDIVPATPGPPLRLLPSTRANYTVLGAATTSVENYRRLATHLLAKNPAIDVDAPSTAFLVDRKPPRLFLGIAQFAEYDAKYH